MKTIYSIIIALMFIVVTPEVYGGCGGGDGGSGVEMTNLPPTEQYQISDDINKNSHNIWDRIREETKKHRENPNKGLKDIKKLQRRLDEENNRRRIAKENAKPNKKVDDLIHQMRIRALLGDDPNALKNLNNRINKIGKRSVATLYVLDLLGMPYGF